MLRNRAVTYRMLGKNEKAAELFEDVLEKEKICLTEDHRDTLQTMTQYAIVLRMQGKRDEVGRCCAVAGGSPGRSEAKPPIGLSWRSGLDA